MLAWVDLALAIRAVIGAAVCPSSGGQDNPASPGALSSTSASWDCLFLPDKRSEELAFPSSLSSCSDSDRDAQRCDNFFCDHELKSRD